MIGVIIPVIVLLAIILIKPIPKIGGNVTAALAIAGVTALLVNGVVNPADWASAWLDGFNRLAWVIWIAIFGMIYSETQTTMGAVHTVLETSRSVFGKSAKGLYVASFVAMIIFGALLGEGLSVAASVGVLIIPAMMDLGLRTTDVSATIVLGALIGSLCPPMSNGIVLASSLAGADYDTVLGYSFITVPLVAIIVIAIYTFKLVKIKELPENLRTNKKVGEILKENWTTLIPTLLLILIMILRYGPWKNTVNLDFVAIIFAPFTKLVSGIPFISGLSNLIVLTLIVCTIVAFFFKPVRERGIGDVIATGFKNYIPCGKVHVACALMLGAFYKAGLIDKISDWAMTLNVHVMKLGGSLAMGLMGMITGSQSTVQNVIFSFFAPALEATGMSANSVALAGAHIAMGSQAFPPSDLCTIVVIGLVAASTGKECDYVKSMMTSLLGFLILYGSGVLMLYILPVMGL
ncbi:MAG: TRAP transporter large permease subunit [Lachnospiraceae bacterium]|nr:TRAP transporter large permease subunit [Lachnospiraceae bacterium]